MKKFLFKDRDGRTPLPEEFKKELIPGHIKTSDELDEFEEANMTEGLVWLEDYKGKYLDYLFWNRLHKKLFGKVWKWAGKFRTHELSIPDFSHPGYISENVRKLEEDLVYWLNNKVFSDDRELVARFHEQFLTIHPYANGNGRTGRILAEYICERENLQIPTWGLYLKSDSKKHRTSYLNAIFKARHQSNYKELIEFMYS